MTGLAALAVALARELRHRLLANGARQTGFCFDSHQSSVLGLIASRLQPISKSASSAMVGIMVAPATPHPTGNLLVRLHHAAPGGMWPMLRDQQGSRGAGSSRRR